MTCANGCAETSACSRACHSVPSTRPWRASRQRALCTSWSPSRSAPTVPSSGAWALPHAGSIAGERAAFRARLASRRAAPTRTGGGTRGGTRGRRVYELTARGDELFHRLLETEEPKPEDGRGLRPALGVRAPSEPAGSPSASSTSSCAAHRRSGRVASGSRRSASALGPLRTLAHRACHRGDRPRSELDRPSHRQRAARSSGVHGARRNVNDRHGGGSAAGRLDRRRRPRWLQGGN